MTSPAKPMKPLSLRECAKMLAEPSMLGERAPAYITLKRWTKAGHLDKARVFDPTSHHPLYRLDALEKIATARTGPALQPTYVVPRDVTPVGGTASANVDPPPTGSPEPFAEAALPTAGPTLERSTSDGPSTEARVDPLQLQVLARISETLLEIRDALAAQARDSATLQSSVDNLDATRKVLMNKYDGEATALKAKVVELQAENGVLKRQATPIDVAKLNIFMSQLSDQMSSLAANLVRNPTTVTYSEI